MDFESCFNVSPTILMEGAIGERLKREYNIAFDEHVAMSGLVYNEHSRQALKEIYTEYVEIANRYNLPFMATTPTRRANKERVQLSGFDETIIQSNVDFLKEIQLKTTTPMYIGGLMGCKGDAYKSTEVLSIEEAFEFHSWAANLFKEASVDFLMAGIMPALPEAIGMAQAMEQTGLPYIISFMIRENGRLIDGTTIHDAIEAIDNATSRKPICYMTNCVHPINLQKALNQSFNTTSLVKERFKGIQANTSSLSPEELDNNQELITSDSISLANDMMLLYDHIDLKILGGCCGTDGAHINELARRIATCKSLAGRTIVDNSSISIRPILGRIIMR